MQLDFALLMGSFGLLMVMVFVILLVINAVFLGIALGFVHGENRELGTTFVTALLMAIVSMIPILGCILSWYFIKTRHNLGWGGAIVAWLITGIIAGIVLFAIIFLIFPGLLTAFMPTMPTFTFTT
ncbi:MAG: hypothetical protein K9W43_12395 [Candidatus Thorarchaeota archaeon]|nr:hypothetical protein [Candidatus Thorarchaeota archaeon]